MVPNKPLREAFERSGLSPQQLAVYLGIFKNYDKNGHPHTCGDGGEIRRALGIRKDSEGKYRQEISEDKALRYMEALNLDPVDIDL